MHDYVTTQRTGLITLLQTLSLKLLYMGGDGEDSPASSINTPLLLLLSGKLLVTVYNVFRCSHLLPRSGYQEEDM